MGLRPKQSKSAPAEGSLAGGERRPKGSWEPPKWVAQGVRNLGEAAHLTGAAARGEGCSPTRTAER